MDREQIKKLAQLNKDFMPQKQLAILLGDLNILGIEVQDIQIQRNASNQIEKIYVVLPWNQMQLMYSNHDLYEDRSFFVAVRELAGVTVQAYKMKPISEPKPYTYPNG